MLKAKNPVRRAKRPPVTGLRLDGELKRLAWQAARTQGLTLTEWMNEMMRRQLRLEGRRLMALQREQWHQLGLPAAAKDADSE